MDAEMAKLESFFNGVQSRGEKVPGHKWENKPNFRAISAGSGVSLSVLRAEPYRQRIVIATKEIGLTPHVEISSKRVALFEENRARLSDYLKWLQDNGYKLPEDPRHRGKIFYNQVVLEAGLSPRALRVERHHKEHSSGVKLSRMVAESRASLGIEVRVLPQSPGRPNASLTYEQLMERGSEERRKELEGKPYAAQRLYNTRSALNRFRIVLKLDKTAPVGQKMAAEFEKAVEEVTGKINSKSSRKKFQTEIHWWRDCYGRLMKEPAIPSDLREAIVHVCDRSGLTLCVISRLIGVALASLKGWYEGVGTPSALSIGPLSRMESLFKLPAGTFTDKISGIHKKRFRSSQLPPYLQKDRSLRVRVIPHLPDNFGNYILDKPTPEM